jgi:hypothetical protein
VKLALAVIGGIAVLVCVAGLVTAVLTRRIEARYPPDGRFVEVAGERLHYVEAGPADGTSPATIVFLHGASSNHADLMLAVGNRLAER